MNEPVEFVGWEWHSSIMKDKDFEAFNSELRWQLEKVWDANNELMHRASTLMGFIGVEFGVLATLSKDRYSSVSILKIFFAMVLISLLASFVSLVMSVRNKHFTYPSLKKLDWIVRNSKGRPFEEIYRYIQNVEDPDKNLESNLVEENHEITKWFGRGAVLATVAQVFLVLIIVLDWLGVC